MRSLGYYFLNRNVTDFILNRMVQWRDPEVKIFFLGFNKCATSAIFLFLARQGIKSAHWQRGEENFAREIERKVDDKAELKRYLMGWTAFSDLTLSSDELILNGNRHFRILHELFPRAYFVLNDRDPERWVASRLMHRQGQYARRSAKFHGCTIGDLRQVWLKERDEHYRAVFEHFEDYDRFLHFKVDRDDVSTLITLLAPHFKLKRHHWRRENVSRATFGF